MGAVVVSAGIETVNLDGLVASASRTLDYDERPERRVERDFAFPELDRRGVYVVELIGIDPAPAELQTGSLWTLTFNRDLVPEVADLKHLEKVVRALRTLRGVIDVERQAAG